MKLYRTAQGFFAERNHQFFSINSPSWDSLVARDDLSVYLEGLIQKAPPSAALNPADVLAPIGNQDVWAAGVTYFRSRDARMEESKSAGGGDFYDRVYAAERPELFFKSTPQRVVGPSGTVAVRNDATWSVPEPELVLLISPGGKIVGYTIGNDMSSRDIEGENPLYLPQAKVYDRSCAIGPCVLVSDEPLPSSTEIQLEILRKGRIEFAGTTSLKELKRNPVQLVEYLYRNNSFPDGCFLFTGTGIVPPDAFTLQMKDEIRITIPPIGMLTNVVG
jgi:2-dehydro-3-deoxy-D-arabinonate dehydratase